MAESALDYSRYFWQGDKVRLRPVCTEDAARVFAAHLDSPSRQILQLGVELPTSPELLKGKLEKVSGCKAVDDTIQFFFETLAGVMVGGIALHSQDRKNGTFSFGVITYRDYWGNGYASDAVRILLKYGFWEQRYQKCNSACVDTNIGSIKLHTKLGFVEEGRRRRDIFMNGEYRDTVLFGLTREEFDAQMKS